jgi:hypothetical protein
MNHHPFFCVTLGSRAKRSALLKSGADLLRAQQRERLAIKESKELRRFEHAKIAILTERPVHNFFT